MAPRETWHFLRVSKEKALFTLEVGSPLPGGTFVQGAQDGEEEGAGVRISSSTGPVSWGCSWQPPQPDEPGGGRLKFVGFGKMEWGGPCVITDLSLFGSRGG